MMIYNTTYLSFAATYVEEERACVSQTNITSQKYPRVNKSHTFFLHHGLRN